jgi:hypothetical protein
LQYVFPRSLKGDLSELKDKPFFFFSRVALVVAMVLVVTAEPAMFSSFMVVVTMIT